MNLLPRLLVFLIACSFCWGGVDIPVSEPQSLSTLSLSEAVRRATLVDPRIAAARLRQQAAQEAITASKASWFPSLIGNATVVGTDGENNRIAAGGGLNNPIVFYRGAFGVNLAWQLYDFGRTSFRVQAARLRANALNEGVETIRSEVVLNVNEAFLGVLHSAALRKTLKVAIDARRALRDQVGALVTNKLKSELDLAFAESALSEAVLLNANAENEETLARTRLAILMGIGHTVDYQLEEPSLTVNRLVDPEVLVQEALASRPDIKRLRLDLESAKKQARAERAAQFPVVSALGAGGLVPYREDKLADNYLVGGLNLSVPFFDGFLSRSKLREANLLVESIAKAVQVEEQRIIRDVRSAIVDLSSVQQRYEMAKGFGETTSKALRLAQIRYSSGSISVVETSQAQLQVLAAQIGELGARYGILKAWMKLQYEVGAVGR
jgi:outer membrane protein TolC